MSTARLIAKYTVLAQRASLSELWDHVLGDLNATRTDEDEGEGGEKITEVEVTVALLFAVLGIEGSDIDELAGGVAHQVQSLEGQNNTRVIPKIVDDILRGCDTDEEPSTVCLTVAFKLSLQQNDPVLTSICIETARRISDISSSNKRLLAQCTALSNAIVSFITQEPSNHTFFNDLESLLKDFKITPDQLIHIFRAAMSSQNDGQTRLISLASSLFDNENNAGFHLRRSSIAFPIRSSNLCSRLRGYTAQTWIKFKYLTDTSILSIAGRINLRMEGGKLVVYDKNMLIDSFESYTLETERYYHITIQHGISSSGQKSGAKLRLFINGDYIHHVRCSFPFAPEGELRATVESQGDQITIGSLEGDFEFTNLMFIAGCQPYEWVALSYFLGRHYYGGYQDDNLLRFLNYNDRTMFNLKLLESSNNLEGELDLNHLQLKVSRDRLLVSFNGDFVRASDEYSLKGDQLSSTSSTIMGNVFLHEGQDVAEIFYSIAPIDLIYQLIESGKTPSFILQSVELLLKLVNSNWKFIREIESANGYSTLVTLLKFKKSDLKQSFGIDLLDALLKFVGYNFTSPFNSIITNHVAYDNLIMDFQLWKPYAGNTTEADVEMIEFLVFQVTVFTSECKYNAFNVLRLKKMKIVRRLLTYISYGFFPEKVTDSVSTTLMTLVRANLTPETIKSLSSFIIYSINEGNEENTIMGLKTLAEVALDPLVTNINYWKKLFGSLSVKHLFLLMELGKKNKLIIDYSLTLLVKNFIMNKKAETSLVCVRDAKIDLTEINILIKGSFGQYQYDHRFEQLATPISTKNLETLVLPELQYEIFDLLEWLVLNDIFQDGSTATVVSLLDSYTTFLSDALENIPSFGKTFDLSCKAFLTKLSNMVVLLTKPQNTPVYFESAGKIVELLSSLVTTKLLRREVQSAEEYTSGILNANDSGTSSNIPTVFLCLVFPKVLHHLKEFSTEFEVLLQTDSLNFVNLAIFLNVLQGEMLTIEWNPSDYFTYMSVVLSLLESYRHSGKSLKNTHYLQLKRNITQILNTLVLVVKDLESESQQENFLTELMFHQESLFQGDMLSNECVAFLMCLLLRIGSSNSVGVSSLSFNLLRIMLMHRHEDLSAICACITFRSFRSVAKFLDQLMTMNDEDVVAEISTNIKLGSTFDTHLESVGAKVPRKYSTEDPLSIAESMSLLFQRHDQRTRKKHQLFDAWLKKIQNENELLRLKIVHNESTRLGRFLQDQQDNIQYDITAYNKLKLETQKRLALHAGEEFPVSVWILDSMEGIDRIRKRLLPYDDLKMDQKLKYSVEVPTKVVQDADDTTDRPRIESLSLNSFELIESDVVDESLSNYNDRNRKVLKSLFPGDKITEIWNVSQVVGLEISESILILGQSHIYLIQNYFHKADTDEIVEITDAPESKRDPSVKLITGQSRPKNASKVSSTQHTVQSWELYKLTSVTKRQFLLRDVALELFFSNGQSFLITCVAIKKRDSIFTKLSSVATNSNIDRDLSSILKESNVTSGNFGTSSRSFGTKLASVFGTEYLNTLDATKKWQNGEMSNFYYLMIINTLAGRTFNDLTQYPVFPWVIADYTSEELDLTDPKSFRDLSKPMGAQSPQRAQQFRDRYEALQSLQDEDAPPFHYGTHYSSAMIVASFLIRLEPFVQSYLLLQGGKFDHADRLFYSIEKAWRSSSKENTTDVRELIPEFFFLPELLTNINGYDFGKLQDGTEISHVELPKWAKGDPKIFITKNREALESPYVSAHLHEWIDLIFGFKQLGRHAVEAINVFNHLSYHGAIDLDSIDDEVERRSITGIIHNFGQTPVQLFPKPHPPRDRTESLSLDFTKIKKAPLLMYQTKFTEAIRYLQFKTHSDGSGDAFWRGYPNLYLSGEIEIKPDPHKGSVMINRKSFERLHDEEITALTRVDDEVFVTGSESGTIHVWRYVVIVKGFEEVLKFETQLRLHSSPIKEFAVSPEFNLLLSLDTDGVCYLWDLARGQLVRKIQQGVEHIAFAYDTGFMATSQDKSVKIYTINGEPVCSTELEGNGCISAISFGNPRTVSTIKINNIESHEYWIHEATLITGWSSGDIVLSVLQMGREGWEVQPMKDLKFAGIAKDAKFKSNEITIVEGYLKSLINCEDAKTGKIEVVAGDVNGRVAVWR